MTARVLWTRPALRQLEDIQDYIARDDPRAAFDVAKRILFLIFVMQLNFNGKIGYQFFSRFEHRVDYGFIWNLKKPTNEHKLAFVL